MFALLSVDSLCIFSTVCAKPHSSKRLQKRNAFRNMAPQLHYSLNALFLPMGEGMTRRVLVLVFFAVSLGTLLAHAGPVIEISEPPCLDTDMQVHNLDNGFHFPTIGGGGQFGFCNKTDEDWHRLLIAIHTTVSADTVTCLHGAFLACNVFSNENDPGFVYVLFDGVSEGFLPFVPASPGVPINERFTVNLDCQQIRSCTPVPDGTGAWTDDTVGFGYANFNSTTLPTPSLPEPGTLALLSIGAVAIGYILKKRRL
jgi:hypothetical protein